MHTVYMTCGKRYIPRRRLIL